MEIIHIAPNGDYEHYENLVLQKEQLEKEALGYRTLYMKEFGELLMLSFEVRVDCISLKKEISLYVQAKSRGETVNPDEVSTILNRYMISYREELDRLLREKNEARKAEYISDTEFSQVKECYRRLAKLLHPDISPLTSQYEGLSELFNRVVIAYKLNDLNELRKLEVLIKKELDEKGIENFNMVIPDISSRIEELEKDIDAIVSTVPYTYKELLKDEEAVLKKKQEIEEEIRVYTEYKNELTEKRNQIRDEK